MSGQKTPGRRQAKYLIRSVVASVFVLSLVSTSRLPASFTRTVTKYHVEIEGVDYGSFDRVTGLQESELQDSTGPFHTISLTRDFVTDPSVYLWAKNTMKNRSSLKDVHVVLENKEGQQIARYVLKYCQPLSWTVASDNPSVGGFHEKIDLAVQEISTF